MKKLIGLVIVISTLVGVSSCSMYHKPFSQEGGKFYTEDDFVLQIDDHGSFWSPEIANKALEKIEESSRNTNTIVLLFIHGWHHNAQIDDQNAIDFSNSLNKTRNILQDNYEGASGIYRRSREILTGNPDVKVIGIYVGWRGKSLPMPLNYLTFWNRKSVAEKVGQGDLREFLARLNQIYKSRSNARKESKQEPFMGMASFGHSFGGQVLFKAISQTFENELIEKTSPYNEQPSKDIDGFGDIVVLVNPALEAFQYERIHRLNQLVNYNSSQVPRLLVFSSEADFARQIFFPLGRAADALFRAPLREQQKELWIEPLGEYEGQRTHDITLITKTDDNEHFDPETYNSHRCDFVNYDLSSTSKIRGVYLKPTKNHKPYNPFLVVYASNDVIFEHSGIFKEELRKFLNDYVAITQGKQMLLNSIEVGECTTTNSDTQSLTIP